MRNTRVVDLQRSIRGARGRRADPWKALDHFITKHSYGAIKNPWGSTTSKIAVSYGKSRTVLEVSVSRLFTGDINDVDVKTTVVRINATDPPDAYEYAISLTFNRGNAVNNRECRASLNLVSKKPTHGVLSGTDALGMAIALCRHVGCDTIQLYDASSLSCEGEGVEEGDRVSLRRARILSRGAGWYESKGFQSVIETLDPGRFRSTIGKLHALRIGTLMNAMTKLDVILRQAIVDRAIMSRLKLARYDMRTEEPHVVAPPSLKAVMSVVSNVSVALDIMTQALADLEKKKHKKMPATLGALVDRLISEDCRKASALVEALLPNSEVYFALTHGPDGQAAPPLPLQEAWVFAWRVTQTFGNLTLRIVR
jgi:hypothetical protein